MKNEHQMLPAKRDRSQVRVFLDYFLRGLLFLFPIAVTIYVIVATIQFLDNLIPVSIPGLGLMLVVGIITLIGYLVTIFLPDSLLRLIDQIMNRMPLVNIIYTSIKDLTEAFIGDKKKFKVPVMVEMTSNGVCKLGFLTRENLDVLNVKGYVAVYFPHSYNFSGNLFVVPVEKIKKLDANSTETMKFIVSGGVTGFGAEKEIVEEESERKIPR
ncbi:MAG: DUF502 domain-containing protein [Bacteroidia bacterium]